MKSHQLVGASMLAMLTLHSVGVAAAQVGQKPGSKAAVPQGVRTTRLAEDPPTMLVTQDTCLSYTYDQNGNRLSQTSAGLNTAPTWGSSTYPCFVWSAG